MMTTKINVPGMGDVVIAGPPENAFAMQRIVDARHAFVLAYCEARGWSEDPEEMTFEQIFEIRSQPGWKHPAINRN